MAEKIAVSDPSLQILQLLQGIGGQKQTQTSSQTQTSTVDPAILAQLSTLLQTQMGQTTPAGIAAVIGQIFNEGSKQVPVLGQQFAQSAGARGSNNSALNLANQQLQTALSGKALEYLLTAQNSAAKTGVETANLTKTTTTNGSQTSTTKPRSNALQLLPFALGQAGNIKKLFNGAADLFGGSGGVPGNPFGSGGMEALNSFDMGSMMDLVSPAADSINAMNSFDTGGMMDLISGTGSAVDVGSMATDALSALSDFDFSSVADIGTFFGDGFFADGGLVGRDNKKVKKSPLNAKPKGYADGGLIRGITETGEMGSEISTFAINDVLPALAGIDGTSATKAPTQAPADGTQKLTEFGLPDYTGETLDPEILKYFQNVVNTRKSGGIVIDGLGSLDSGVHATGVQDREGNYYQLNSWQGGHAGSSGEYAVNVRKFGKDFKPGSADSYYKTTPFDKTYNLEDGTFQDIQVNTKPVSGAQIGLSWLASVVGMMTGNPALAVAKGMGGVVANEAIKNIVGGKLKPHMFGGVNKQNPDRDSWVRHNMFADGGEIEGPGTGISDDIPVRVSDGEYIVSADVVEALTPEFFDMLQQMFHTPAAIQSAKGN